MLDVAIRHRQGAFSLDVAFSAPERGVTALFGPSGSGKSTVINAIAGLVRPAEGVIRFDGITFFDRGRGIDLPVERRRIGYVFQDARLFPHLRVEGNLLYGWRRVPESERRIPVDAVVDLLGLRPLLRRPPYTLSGGERQRVALGRALLAQPRLLLMDEPLAALDLPRKAEILPYIERLRDELRLPIVYVSHAVEEVVRLADLLVVMTEGRAVAAGPLIEVMNRLDLRAVTGGYDFGAVIEAAVAGHDEPFRLTVLDTAGGELRVPRFEAPPGRRVRVRIRARDVALARCPPEQSSVLNVLTGRVAEIELEDGPDAVVRIDLGSGAVMLATVTRLSVHRLDLRIGETVHALIKAVALERGGAMLAPRYDPERPEAMA